MNKKEKKIFKKHLLLAPKVTLNRKWTVWRQPQIKKIKAYSIGLKHSLISNYIKNLPNTNVDFTSTAEIAMNSTNSFSSISSLKSFCLYVGRSRGYLRSLAISRHTTRRLARFGALSGIIKERC